MAAWGTDGRQAALLGQLKPGSETSTSVYLSERFIPTLLNVYLFLRALLDPQETKDPRYSMI